MVFVNIINFFKYKIILNKGYDYEDLNQSVVNDINTNQAILKVINCH